MKYSNVAVGRFISRPNRFIAQVSVNGMTETVHVKNTGRCRELLIPGCVVYLAFSENPSRKTRYDLIAVEKNRGNGGQMLINIDSQAPNAAVAEWLPRSGIFSESAKIWREVTFRNSRFDFYIEDGVRKAFLEVKGCTLEQGGIARFPDAPTERGVKHVHELIQCLQHGYEAYILFVVQMKGMREFYPNDETHPQFGQALREAQRSGVHVLAMDCQVTANEMWIDSPVKVRL